MRGKREMLMGKIDEFVRELKKSDENVIGVIVTDDSGLKIYPPKSSDALDALGGALVSLINSIKDKLNLLGLKDLKLLTLRIEDYIIIMIPSNVTNTIIVKRKR